MESQSISMSETELRISPVTGDLRPYMPLLLAGDESEAMIARYIGRATLYAGHIGGRVAAVCAVTDEGPDVVEVKNLAVGADMRRHGIGRAMLAHVEELNRGKTIRLGTGETPSTLRFYHGCGYRETHRVAGFFTRNYDHPIVEEGVTLRDMIYLSKQA